LISVSESAKWSHASAFGFNSPDNSAEFVNRLLTEYSGPGHDLFIGHVRGGVQKDAGPADLRKDDVGDPAHKLRGLGFAGLEDEFVEAGFVDNNAPAGVATVAPILNFTSGKLHLFVDEGDYFVFVAALAGRWTPSYGQLEGPVKLEVDS